MSEFSEIENISGEADYSRQREMWSPDFLISQQEVEIFLTNPLFAQNVVDAITKTDETHETDEKKYHGREFGFIGFFSDGKFEPICTPLFEGDEHSINLMLQSSNFMDRNPDVDSEIILAFHTHPARRSLGEGKLIDAIFQRKPSSKAQIFQNFFSTSDLKIFKHLALDESLSLILALGTVEEGKRGLGKVVLITPQSFEALVSMDPKNLVKRIMDYKLTAGKDYLDAYREAGLNVAVLPVNLDNQPHINPSDIKLASQILTTRT